VRVQLAIASILLALPALADDELPTYKNLMRQGYEAVGTQFFNNDFVVLVARGEDSFLCTFALVKEDEVYSGGPWNNYRECKRLSGGADFCFDADGNEMECKD
jgi:hypothetical protein